MPLKKLLSIIFLLLTAFNVKAFQTTHSISVIPKPVAVTGSDGVFEIKESTRIFASQNDKEFLELASYLAETINTPSWFRIQPEIKADPQPDNGIYLILDKKGSYENDEAYTLSIKPNGVILTAPSYNGIFYGIQTIKQLLPIEIENQDPSLTPNNQQWVLPAVEISDYPRFQYRGMHLDVGRHFFPVSFIKKYIDLLAMHKMNRFHWHLTEDQGWRIEIKKYPKLTETGAWRDSTLVGHYGTKKYDGKPYGGFYTQNEIREVVAYAKNRYITIIPEIELPGHSTAALAAYPEFGCVEKEYSVQTTWGIFEDIYCPKEETFSFLEDVMDEVMDLFPGTYIHIGGDEAPKTQWKESDIAQKLIQKENLKDEHALQSYFIQRIEKYLNKHGRQIIGWDEILEGGLAPKATVMSWRGEKGGIEAAKMHHDVIMTPGKTNYFDYYQATPATEPLAIGGLTTVEDVYNYEPVPKELTGEEAKYVLGAQGNVWTEYIHSPQKVEYMAFPRATALAEVLWSPKDQKDWLNFQARLQTQFARFEKLDVNYAPHFKETLLQVKNTK